MSVFFRQIALFVKKGISDAISHIFSGISMVKDVSDSYNRIRSSDRGDPAEK